MASHSTPLMDQYLSIKKHHKDAILFFRMGDFYEMFYEDAKTAADVLGITLTSRAHGKSADVPLAGFPHHSVEPYLSKMLRAGYRVAICEQVEDPKKAKGIVKREVIEVITPGTATSENVIDAGANNFLVSIYIEDSRAGLSAIDISTGEFYLSEGSPQDIALQIESINPPEIVYSVDQRDEIISLIKWSSKPLFSPIEEYYYNKDYAHDTLLSHFKTVSLKGFGIEEYPLGISAAGAVLKYLGTIQSGRLGHIRKLTIENPDSFMVLDKSTRRNLELVSSMHDNNRYGTLVGVIDRTVTKMGARTLKSWLLRPLIDSAEIKKRLNAVDEFYQNNDLNEEVRFPLEKINDIERLIAKINSKRANGRDLRALYASLILIPDIKEALGKAHSDLLVGLKERIEPLEELASLIDQSISENPPALLSKEGVIKTGYDSSVDEFRELSDGGKAWITKLQEDERERTGISSLKISYNKVFGYYIEVTRTHSSKVPENYIRKQTLVNAERFITPEMKDHEEKILSAEEKLLGLERELFEKICTQITGYTEALQMNADSLSRLDVLRGLAEIAHENQYCKPRINDGTSIYLTECRHPVVERMLPPGEPFIPNDHNISAGEDQIHIITGPNMAGKSTFLRQVGLAALLAQIGSFVPASEAEIGVVDRVFTRVGAMDDVSKGESTFLVEMLELANILNNATPKSLLLLDEIGRGTSTFDGLSIAWATVEYLHNHERCAAKTLFATHYHELTAVGQKLPRVKNYNVLVKEYGDTIVFLRKIERGCADHSYGIQVARMAGIPQSIIDRAKDILEKLEAMELTPHKYLRNDTEEERKSNFQVSLFSYEDTVLREKLNSLNPETLSPLEALQILFELKHLMLGGENPLKK